jgi:hypothetical protein
MVGAESVDARSRNYQELKSRVHNDLLNRLDLERLTRLQREVAEPEIRSLIVVMLERESAATPLSLFERESLIADVLNELFGLGPLEMLLHDGSISDILINRHDQVYIEREGKLEETEVMFKDDAHLMQIIERIVSSVGRRIDESSPMVDARLADGSRVNAIIPPLALDGPAMSIRRFRTDRLGADDLVNARVVDPADARLPEGSHRLPPQPDRVRWNRRRQDDAAEHSFELYRRQRAGGDDRGRRRAGTSGSAMLSAWKHGRRTSRAKARSAPGSWWSTPFVCVPTASSSAKSAARKRSTCCRR